MKTLIYQIIFVIVFSATAHAQKSCRHVMKDQTTHNETPQKEYKNAASIGPNRPALVRDGNKTTLNWKELLDQVQNQLASSSSQQLAPLTVTVLIDGVPKFIDLPASQTQITVEEKPGLQTDYFLEFKNTKGEVVHRSDLELKETKDAQNVRASSFSGVVKEGLFSVRLNDYLKRNGVSEQLTEAATRLGYNKIVWVLKPEADKAVRKTIDEAPEGVEVELLQSEDRKPLAARMFDKKTGALLLDEINVRKNLFIKVDAAFNGNSFLWDDALVALATVPYAPDLAVSTLEFWIAVQNLHGGIIPREIRKSNLKSLWFRDVIRNGKNLGENLQYTNPYLLNWVGESVYNHNPSPENLNLLARLNKSMEDYLQQMETHRSIKDKTGRIIGFNANSLGSGADNSRGERGNDHSPDSYQSAWVDMIAQTISMYKSLSKTYTLLAQKSSDSSLALRYQKLSDLRQQKALAYESILNQLYWNETEGFYYDLIPDGHGGHKQDSRYESIAGFWPLYSASASPGQVQKMIERQLTPDAFGGPWPLRVNSLRALKNLDPKSYDPKTKNYMENLQEDGYWDKWAHWPSMAAIVIEGFRRSGRPDVAFSLSVKFLKGMADASQTTVYELYGEKTVTLPSGETLIMGRPGQHGHHQTRADFAGWGKVPPIYNMLLHVLGLDPQPGVLNWNLMVPMKVGETLTARNLVYEGNSLQSLEIQKVSERKYRVKVNSKTPFNLEVALYVKAGRTVPNPVARSLSIRVGGEQATKSYEIEF